MSQKKTRAKKKEETKSDKKSNRKRRKNNKMLSKKAKMGENNKKKEHRHILKKNITKLGWTYRIYAYRPTANQYHGYYRTAAKFPPRQVTRLPL
jgi:hypothetical protein